jgi:hypothetical protein
VLSGALTHLDKLMYIVIQIFSVYTEKTQLAVEFHKVKFFRILAISINVHSHMGCFKRGSFGIKRLWSILTVQCELPNNGALATTTCYFCSRLTVDSDSGILFGILHWLLRGCGAHVLVTRTSRDLHGGRP